MPVPYDDLDQGIRDVVRLLNDNGFQTSDSGDGVSKIGTPGEDCMLKVPNVIVMSERNLLLDNADSLLVLLMDAGVRVGPDKATVDELAGPQPEGTKYGDGVMVEATYDPANESAIILVTGLDDILLACCTGRPE